MIKLVLWDWNGTLLDDLSQSLEAVNVLLRSDGIPEIDAARYRECTDTPIAKFYAHFYSMEKTPFERVATVWRNAYNDLSPTLTLTNGALEALGYFRANGAVQAIVSAAHSEDVVPYAERFGIADYFDEIITADDRLAGSKIEKAKKYFEKKGIPAADTLFVGDTLHDLETARALGVRCILVRCGHQGEKEFAAAGFTDLADDPAGLIGVL